MCFFSIKKSGRTLVKTAALLTLLAGVSVAGLKYVAVVESDVDVASGASAGINPAEVREITAELRRQATQNLPLGRYSVMTAETIQSMGGAVLEECSEENCVVALGSKIGADYIVRGTISKFQTRFTLTIELYETDNGTLVVSSDAVRSENIEELLDKAAEASAKMYKIFVDGQKNAQPAQESVASENAHSVNAGGGEQQVLKPSAPGFLSFKYPIPLGFDIEWGWFLENSRFFGADLSLRVVSSGFPTIGAGLSYGYTFDMPYGLRGIAGASAGIWFCQGEGKEYNSRDAWENRKEGKDVITSVGEASRDFVGPFLKVQSKYIEIMYRGLLGVYTERRIGHFWYGDTDAGRWGNGWGADELKSKSGFGWNQNQLMIGINLDNSWLDYGGYSFNRRSVAWLMNFVPGLGSMIIMEDYLGGCISLGFVLGGTVVAAAGAGSAGAIAAISGGLFNFSRPWLYKHPAYRRASVTPDGFKFAAFPNDGELQYVGTYTKSF
jgi:hypothetical protein